ncbi:DUF1830 domain-containing protein [Pseudanabaena sp. FACHB-2040]|uniref:DUF1830 domain-containing protein n=1 Tax=Pseudanabaena sp. FACHB-2040 TaxID=2692859 RepID=UPI001684A667|nr:DUF1830 domain-containing protein [Pseudanabaena sp. FACHB-2040]MBD2256906.1 DUF1830 domain-containing protein [Pseudanabaena sp. FACHB-2040]
MSYIPSFSDVSQRILCYYSNHSSHVQVALVSNLPGLRLEQVLFPGQRWMFWSHLEAILEIYATQSGKPVLIEQVSCAQLQVVEQAARSLVH